jgi:hypothetical protein
MFCITLDKAQLHSTGSSLKSSELLNWRRYSLIYNAIQRFIAVFTEFCHLTLSLTSWMQSKHLHILFLEDPIQLCSRNLQLDLATGLFWDFRSKFCMNLSNLVCVLHAPTSFLILSPYLKFHVGESFLRTYSESSSPFLKPDGSVACSQNSPLDPNLS